MADDREEIIRVFQYWRFVTTHLSADIHEVLVDASGSKAVVFFTQTIENMGHMPFVSFDLSMAVLLYLEPTLKGGKLISKQVDFHSFESILFSNPLIGILLDRGFRKFSSWQIIRPTAFVAKHWPVLELFLREKVPIVDKNWGTIVDIGRKLWWRKETKFKGRKLAPYDPAL